MSIKWSQEPLLANATRVDLLGYDCRRLSDGRILMFEWVGEEGSGVVQVHDDEGRDYIEEGNPTLGMLYDSADVFLDLHEDELRERLRRILGGT